MKWIIILMTPFFYYAAVGQNQFNAKSLSRKTIYCVKITEKEDRNATTTSFNDVDSYSYLFKTRFEENGDYSSTDKFRAPSGRGKYYIKGNIINLVAGDLKIPIAYRVVFYSGPYITLSSGNKTYYCFIN